MAVDLEKLKWAINDITENVALLDEEGNPTGEIVAVDNKTEPTSQFKDSGLLYEEPLPRAYTNFILYQIYLAIQDLDARVTALEP